MENEHELVPSVRVKHYNYETDEDEIGTVIDQSNMQYLVVPDYNLGITIKWFKHNCSTIR